MDIRCRKFSAAESEQPAGIESDQRSLQALAGRLGRGTSVDRQSSSWIARGRSASGPGLSASRNLHSAIKPSRRDTIHCLPGP
jgi:hypothetical protein